MVMEKRLIERITRSHSELWRYDCNHLKVSSGLAASEYEFRGMAVLSEEAAEKEAPAVKRLVKTCYERDYFKPGRQKVYLYGWDPGSGRFVQADWHEVFSESRRAGQPL